MVGGAEDGATTGAKALLDFAGPAVLMNDLGSSPDAWRGDGAAVDGILEGADDGATVDEKLGGTGDGGTVDKEPGGIVRGNVNGKLGGIA